MYEHDHVREAEVNGLASACPGVFLQYWIVVFSFIVNEVSCVHSHALGHTPVMCVCVALGHAPVI